MTGSVGCKLAILVTASLLILLSLPARSATEQSVNASACRAAAGGETLSPNSSHLSLTPSIAALLRWWQMAGLPPNQQLLFQVERTTLELSGRAPSNMVLLRRSTPRTAFAFDPVFIVQTSPTPVSLRLKIQRQTMPRSETEPFRSTVPTIEQRAALSASVLSGDVASFIPRAENRPNEFAIDFEITMKVPKTAAIRRFLQQRPFVRTHRRSLGLSVSEKTRILTEFGIFRAIERVRNAFRDPELLFTPVVFLFDTQQTQVEIRVELHGNWRPNPVPAIASLYSQIYAHLAVEHPQAVSLAGPPSTSEVLGLKVFDGFPQNENPLYFARSNRAEYSEFFPFSAVALAMAYTGELRRQEAEHPDFSIETFPAPSPIGPITLEVIERAPGPRDARR